MQLRNKDWSNFLFIKKKFLVIHVLESNCYDGEAYLDELNIQNLSPIYYNLRGIFHKLYSS